tara:strand:+ start:77 stop:319 length:243 start_codon:yes stop_codon:yes gene_type:complete
MVTITEEEKPAMKCAGAFSLVVIATYITNYLMIINEVGVYSIQRAPAEKFLALLMSPFMIFAQLCWYILVGLGKLSDVIF